MGSTYAQGFADAAAEGTISRENALRCHLQCNFFPPLPQFVVDSTVEAFKGHWENGDPIDEAFRDKCYLRTVDLVYHYHGPFINPEED